MAVGNWAGSVTGIAGIRRGLKRIKSDIFSLRIIDLCKDFFFCPSGRARLRTKKLIVTCLDQCFAPVHFLEFGDEILNFPRDTTLLLAPKSVLVQTNLVVSESTA